MLANVNNTEALAEDFQDMLQTQRNKINHIFTTLCQNSNYLGQNKTTGHLHTEVSLISFKPLD